VVDIIDFNLYRELYGYNFTNQLIYTVGGEIVKAFENDFYVNIYHLEVDRYVVLFQSINDKRLVDSKLHACFKIVSANLMKLNTRVKLSFNAGVYRLQRHVNLDDPSKILYFALDALQDAKNINEIGNHIAHFDSDLHKQKFNENHLITHISESIDHAKLGLTYKQIVNISKNEVYGYNIVLNLDNYEIDYAYMDYVVKRRGLTNQLEKYAVIVIYRCKKDAVLEKLVKAAQQKQIPVLYDIDDYVFDYDAISYLDFLKDDEYADFRKTTESIQDMMALCNGFLTSTETLRRKIQTHFPGKRVFVNRNVASLEMVAWSKKATASVNRDRNRVILGYFSGSGTHNKDFSKIEDIIIRLMKKYPYVYLKTGGVLNVNPKFTPFKNRMIHFDFMDWRNLPEQIASVDINLMPLEDTEFHACKSENKWTEAGLVGVPTIATLNEELAMVIKDGENGMLAANETEWEEKLDCLISDKTLRERIGDNARQKVYENHLTQNTGADALEFLYKIISQK